MPSFLFLLGFEGSGFVLRKSYKHFVIECGDVSIEEIVQKMSKVKEYAAMTKDKLMTYTLVALVILVGVSYLSFGITSLIAAALAVLVAVGIDLLISKVVIFCLYHLQNLYAKHLHLELISFLEPLSVSSVA